jgi:hypothetical protein
MNSGPISSIYRTHLRILADMRAWYFVIVIMICGVPWTTHIFPTQDGPLHVYNGWLLRELLINKYHTLSIIYRFNPLVLANCVATYMLALFSSFLSSVNSCKLMTSCCVAVLSAASWTACRTKDNQASPLSFLLLPLNLSWFTFLGFYNFSLSMAAAIMAIAAINSFAISRRTTCLYKLCAWLTACALCHPFTFLELVS